MSIIPVSRDISGSLIKAPGGFVVSVFNHPTNRALYGFERTSERALSWLCASCPVFDHAEGGT